MTVFHSVEGFPSAEQIGKEFALQWYSTSESWAGSRRHFTSNFEPLGRIEWQEWYFRCRLSSLGADVSDDGRSSGCNQDSVGRIAKRAIVLGSAGGLLANQAMPYLLDLSPEEYRWSNQGSWAIFVKRLLSSLANIDIRMNPENQLKAVTYIRESVIARETVDEWCALFSQFPCLSPNVARGMGIRVRYQIT